MIMKKKVNVLQQNYSYNSHEPVSGQKRVFYPLNFLYGYVSLGMATLDVNI